MIESQKDNYEIVRQKMKLGPIFAPKHPKVDKLLRIFWNEEEIEILAQFNSCDTPTALRELVERTSKSKEELKEILKEPLRKKTISQVGSKYTLLPLLPGIFEQYYIERQDTEENLKLAAKHFRFLFKNFLPSFFQETAWKIFRPRLPLDAGDKLIKVDESIDVEQKTLSYELVKEIIDKYDHFLSVPCQCRLIGELTGEPCEVASSELGCFVAGPIAETAMREGAQVMTKDEATEFLKKTEKAGLVHQVVADNSVDSGLVMCNCCSCHCGALITGKQHKIVGTIPSNYKPVFNNDLCKKCDLCLKKCPMGVIYHHYPNKADKSDEYMYLIEKYCIGCGVCAANCPNDALRLVKVRDEKFSERSKIGNKTFLELLM